MELSRRVSEQLCTDYAAFFQAKSKDAFEKHSNIEQANCLSALRNDDDDDDTDSKEGTSCMKPPESSPKPTIYDNLVYPLSFPHIKHQ